MKRSIIVRFKDGSKKELPLSKATLVKSTMPFLHVDQLKDGTFRLVWGESLVKDFSQVEGIDILRVD